jgi:membrane fusion protein, multidrug efflux system
MELSQLRLPLSALLWAALAGGAAFAATPTPAPSAVPVTTVVAATTNFPVMRTGLGSVHAYNTVTVKSRVDGAISKIAFKEGDMVKAGDLLATIDDAPYQANLEAAKGKVAQDQASLTNASADLARYSTLAKSDFASTQQVDTQQALVRQDTAQIQSDQAAVMGAQVQLDYTQIHAPIAGRLGFRLVDQGNIVTAAGQNGIVTINQLQPISVVFALPEADLEPLRTAQGKGDVAVKALSADGATVLAQGKVEVINNQVDPATGTFQVKATFTNEDNALWPGLDVSATAQIGVLQNAVVLPQTAVEHSQQGLFAYVVGQDGKVALHAIQVGESDADNVVVTKGISPGDKVVVAGQYRLQDGTLVSESAPQANNTQTKSQ